jgi:hypothetical protein
MRFISRWAVLGLIGMVSPAQADGISGTYVGQSPGRAYLVQIVETPGGQLTGRYEQTVLQPTGQLDRMNASITGASDGQTVVLTMKRTEVLSGSITASGTLQGSILHLSGSGDGSKIDLTVVKSDEAAYQRQVATLGDQARGITEVRVTGEQIAHLNGLTTKMLSSSTAFQGELPKFPPIEQRYRAVTEWMRAAFAREQLIFGGGQAAVARSQISISINQAKVQGDQLHADVQGAGQKIRVTLEPLLKDATEAVSRCQDAAHQDAAYQSACTKIIEAVKTFNQSIERYRLAFDQTEKVWLDEQRKQQEIIQAADFASR